METNIKTLGIRGELTIETVKKAYFNKIREYPPEEYEDEFIEINKAYEEIVEYLNNVEGEKENLLIKDTLDLFFTVLNKGIETSDMQLVNNTILAISNMVNIYSFQFISDYSVDYIIKLNQLKCYWEARLLIIYLEKAFNSLGLLQLGKTYRELEMFILLNMS